LAEIDSIINLQTTRRDTAMKAFLERKSNILPTLIVLGVTLITIVIAVLFNEVSPDALLMF